MQSNFRELEAWQVSMDLAMFVYQLTAIFPEREQQGLTSQIRNSLLSIPSRIAEGAGQDTDTAFAQFLNLAQCSTFELETQLLLAQKMNFAPFESVERAISLLTEVQKMVYGLKKSLLKNKNSLK
ncbi:MAG: four helix bundle protein [Aureispira sp.]|nr:four helix bundle protein [Aureispira sp.]